jgi:ribonuclease HII
VAASPRPDRLRRLDERVRRRLGVEMLAGVDEVGRGCLAGPVVVAAVVLPATPGAAAVLDGVRDSKAMSANARERAFVSIRSVCVAMNAWAVPVELVDELNVLGASLLGMERVIARLERRHALHVEHVLVDGHRLPASLVGRASALVKGDDRSLSVAAASVVAKVLRDRLMRAWARRFPQYGFERHVGYPTPVHLASLRMHGPCPLHRRSFAPVAQAAMQLRWSFGEGGGS